MRLATAALTLLIALPRSVCGPPAFIIAASSRWLVVLTVIVVLATVNSPAATCFAAHASNSAVLHPVLFVALDL